MAGWKSRVGKLALILAGTVIAGCPQDLEPRLNVTPGAVDFGVNQTTRNISLQNTGGGTLEWTAREVSRTDPEAPWEPADVPWLSLGTASGAITNELQNIELTATREGLDTGLFTNSGIQITSNSNTVTVPVSLTVDAALRVSPTTVALSNLDTTAGFTIRNNGSVPLNWSLAFLPDPEDPETDLPFPPGFTVAPLSGTTQTLSSTAVSLSFPAGRQDFGVRVSSDSGNATVVFTVGAGLEGFLISPSSLRVSQAEGATGDGEQPSSILTIENVGSNSIEWTIALRDRVDAETAPPLSANPVQGTTAPGATSEVAVRVTDPAAIVQGEGRYELLVQSGGSFQVVPIIIDVLPVPEIALSRPPDTEVLQPPVVRTELLDFGMDEIQLQFWVVNTGSIDSELFFEITHEDQGAGNAVIASVTPLRGNTNGPDRDFYLNDQQVYVDGVPISVTIDRGALVENVETRTLTVRAFDSTFENRQATVEARTIQIRAEKQPFQIAGALNRSRPPNLLRFVLSNRDDLGRIVPLQTESERARLAYDILENEIFLDLDETSQFLTFDYRGNVVLMLDFTGSMFNAGTGGEDPLEPGEAVALMREAAGAFIDDLPPNFRMQLMYYSDRIGEDRVIQRFTSDRALLREALARFSLPPALFGNSDIFDALGMAMEDLAEEDPPSTLPFDDADLRAVVFITDGEDTVSGMSASDVESLAEDTKTRLYPVAYSPNGEPINRADLLTLADSSGGHVYNVSTARDLRDALGTRGNMRLIAREGAVNDRAVFTIENLSAQAIDFETENAGNSPWLGDFSPSSGVIAGNSTREIAVALNPSGAAIGLVLEGAVNVRAGNSTGEVAVEFRTGEGGTVSDVATIVRDEDGTVWHEFNNQSVLTYMTPKEDSFTYRLSGRYTRPDNRVIEGVFERDGNFIIGDPLMGQVSLRTDGIVEDRTTVDPGERFRSEVSVYADYVPRNTTQFSFRFFTLPPDDVTAQTAALLEAVSMRVEIADDGILADDNVGTSDWRLIADGDGRYRLITETASPLPVGSFGRMLKLTFTNLGAYVDAFGGGARRPEFLLGMRMDNQIYVSPASDRQPSTTKFFLYPGGLVNPERVLSVEMNREDLAGPAEDVALLTALPGFNPEAPGAFDPDEDFYPNFNDPFPFNDELPGPQIVPNPFEIDGDVTEFTLTVANSTLDRYEWSVNEATLPPWLPAGAIRYGDAMDTVPQGLLLPGESETVHFVVDRSGQTPGTAETAIVEFDIRSNEFTFFVPESVPVTLVTNP